LHEEAIRLRTIEARLQQLKQNIGFVPNLAATMANAPTVFAKANGAPDDILEAVRNGNLPDDVRLAALVGFTHEVVCNDGEATAVEIRKFLEAGFTQAQVLEVLINVSQATLASLVHRLSKVPVDEGFHLAYHLEKRRDRLVLISLTMMSGRISRVGGAIMCWTLKKASVTLALCGIALRTKLK